VFTAAFCQQFIKEYDDDDDDDDTVSGGALNSPQPQPPQRNVPNERGVGFFGDFRPIYRHISKTVHCRHKVTIGR